jgi:hypothetical protein
MRVRTPEEIKTYAEGYNACYEDFRRELLKKHKTLAGALATMEVINSAVMKLAKREETE